MKNACKRIECKHSIKGLQRIESRSHDLGNGLLIHYAAVDWETFNSKDRVSVISLVIGVKNELTNSKAIFFFVSRFC